MPSSVFRPVVIAAGCILGTLRTKHCRLPKLDPSRRLRS
jgi:hypothetical protein